MAPASPTRQSQRSLSDCASTRRRWERRMIDLIHSETIDRPGLYRMSEAAYHADTWTTPSISRSIALKLITESPRHALTAHPRLTKQDDVEIDNDNTREIGSAAHALLLHQPTEIHVVYKKDWKTKAAQE